MMAQESSMLHGHTIITHMCGSSCSLSNTHTHIQIHKIIFKRNVLCIEQYLCKSPLGLKHMMAFAYKNVHNHQS